MCRTQVWRSRMQLDFFPTRNLIFRCSASSDPEPKGPHTSTMPFKVGVEAPAWATEGCLRSCKRGSTTCWEAPCHARRFKGPLKKTTHNCKGMAQTTSEIISFFVSRAGWLRAALVPIKAQAQLQNSNGTHILGSALLPAFLYHRADTQYMQLIWQISRFKNNLASSVHIVGNFSNLSIRVDLKAGLASFVNAVTCLSHAWCPVI